MESTLAGWQSTLFSLTSAAATYCGIMNPELSPPSWVRNAGRPSESDGFASRSTRRSEMDANSASAIADRVEGERKRLAVEVAVGDELVLLDEDERVVGGRVELDRDRRLRVREEIAARAVHLRRAPERVGVLHLVAPAVRLEDRRAFEQAERCWPPTRPDPAAVAARGSRAGSSTREPCSASSESAQARSAVFASRRARTSASAPAARHELRPVDERETLLRLRAGSARDPTRARASAPGSILAVDRAEPLAHQREREVGERREVAGGADGAAARNDRGQRRGSGKPGGARQSRRARPSSPWRACSRAAASRPGRSRRGYGLADPARVAPQKAELKLVRELDAGWSSRRSGRSRC